MTHFFTSFLIILGAALLAIAALHDAATRTVPNWISVGLTAIGLFVRIQGGEWVASVAIAVIIFGALMLLWVRGLVGGADVKLIPAASLLLTPSGVPAYLFYLTMAGGLLALLYLSLSYVVRRPPPGARHGILARVVKAETWRIHRRGPLPYAVAIAIGALPFVLKTLSE
jgi:prepilin peptidase CpaA